MFGHILKRDKKLLIFKLQEKFDKKKGLYLLEKIAQCVFDFNVKHSTISYQYRDKFVPLFPGTSSSLQFCSEMLQLALELYQSFGSHAR